MQHSDFSGMRCFARADVLRCAARLGYPRIEYANFWCVRQPIEGAQQWNACGLSTAPGRRDALLQLVAIEHAAVKEQATR